MTSTQALIDLINPTTRKRKQYNNLGTIFGSYIKKLNIAGVVYLMGVLGSGWAVTGPAGVVRSSPFQQALQEASVEKPCSILARASLFFVFS